MAQEKITPLRERMMEDMRIHGMGDKAQKALSQSFSEAERELTLDTIIRRGPRTA